MQSQPQIPISLVRIVLSSILIWMGFHFTYQAGSSVLMQLLPFEEVMKVTLAKGIGTLVLLTSTCLLIGLFTRISSIFLSIVLAAIAFGIGEGAAMILYSVGAVLCGIFVLIHPDATTLDVHLAEKQEAE